jgi:arylsulfatase
MGDRTSLTLYEGMVGLMENAFINIKNRSYSIRAEIETRTGDSQGVIISQAGKFGGWALYMRDGKAFHTYNYFGLETFNVASAATLPVGRHVIEYVFEADSSDPGTGGRALLLIDGRQVAEGRIPKTIPFFYSADEGVDIGMDNETNVSEDYKAGDNRFSGRIHAVTVSIK